MAPLAKVVATLSIEDSTPLGLLRDSFRAAKLRRRGARSCAGAGASTDAAAGAERQLILANVRVWQAECGIFK